MRYLPRAALALGTISFVAAASCAPVRPATAPTPEASSSIAPALDSALAPLFALGLSPGFGVVVVRDSNVIYRRGFGHADVESQRPFTDETVFYIASTTKSFTGLAAALLDQQGRFRLDAPLSQYLPQLRLHAPLTADSITIRSLLAHTHGIGDGPVVARLAFTGVYRGNDELIELLAQHPPARGGRNFEYGNIGYNVATLAMDAMLGESWKQTLDRLLFQPLGMTSTSAYVSRYQRDRLASPYRYTLAGFVPLHYGKIDQNMQSAGGLMTTLRDMGRWLEVHINDGRLDGRQVLPASAVAESHRIQATTAGNLRGFRHVGYTLGWNVLLRGSDTLLAHGGGFPGFATHMSFLPQRRVGVVTMANNSQFGGVLAELAAMEIYRVVLGESASSTEPTAAQIVERARAGVTADLTRRAGRPQNLPFPLEAYTGRFDNPLLGRFEIVLVDGRLEARLGAARSPIEVFDNANNRLRVEVFGSGQVVNVEMRDGRAASLTFEGVTFQRVD